MPDKRAVGLLLCCLVLSAEVWTARATEPSYDMAARYILEIVKAFRTAYVLNVVEHAKNGGIRPHEDWQRDAHFIPLPAQFVKAAADQVEQFEVGLIGLNPLNRANLPKTQAETDALMRLVAQTDRRIVSFIDGDQFKAVSADLALVNSCVDCHNQHPQATRRDFQRWDVMGGIIVRLKRDARSEGMSMSPDAPQRPAGRMEKLTPPMNTPPPWAR